MNTRLAVATHILTFLETQNGKAATSDLIALSVNTNPSFIRRLLAQLARAGLTTSQLGAGGGALLARPGETISLLDIYDSVNEEGDALLPVHEDTSQRCEVGRSISGVLKTRLTAAEVALREELARTTIKDMAAGVAEANRVVP
ncbi:MULTISPECIES: Rrf2 family transcriptional regulator [unclassified Aureimonas]|uniref:Rrf2 family transcriptional regulator n=1 Tax=unclassified Aureimonas TaxID=2615206 RepID=UPI0007016683|nr:MULTISPECIES: Rrf2 family transcriptional regulator [unclassified Aureimonas]KQT65968.1 Rrf2 family transcriptional regulator [Aureimonas sp. Leaf427]KQT73327.1 Rrf2 family transcriptional regulator [Aureimonas sp. Leaf460]